MGYSTLKIDHTLANDLLTKKNYEVVSASSEHYFTNWAWRRRVSSVEKVCDDDNGNKPKGTLIYTLNTGDFVELQINQ